MDVGIKGVAEDIRTQPARHVNGCFFSMVADGDERKPVPVAPLRPFSPDERRRHAAAVVRKQMRVEQAQRFKALESQDAAGVASGQAQSLIDGARAIHIEPHPAAHSTKVAAATSPPMTAWPPRLSAIGDPARYWRRGGSWWATKGDQQA